MILYIAFIVFGASHQTQTNNNCSHKLLTQILISTNIYSSLYCRWVLITMYVCLCKGITDRQIEAAVHDGARSLGKLRKTLGVASQCGKCTSLTREILDDTLQDTPTMGGMAQFYAVA